MLRLRSCRGGQLCCKHWYSVSDDNFMVWYRTVSLLHWAALMTIIVLTLLLLHVTQGVIALSWCVKHISLRVRFQYHYREAGLGVLLLQYKKEERKISTSSFLKLQLMNTKQVCLFLHMWNIDQALQWT